MTKRMVLGLGGCVDYEIGWSSLILQELVDQYGITYEELGNTSEILDERSLVSSVLDYFRRGIGGERHVASPGVLESFAARFPRRVTLGGSSVRAGLALSVLGIPSTLHLVSMNDNFRTLLPPQCAWISSSTHDSTEPHLILQWPAGERIRVSGKELISTFPNRLIYVNDEPNSAMRLSPLLPEALEQAEIFLISGLNAMRSQQSLATRLKELQTVMDVLPASSLVFYEDAGFHVPAFSALVRKALLERIDIYSMNEDELQTYVGRAIDLLNPDDVIRAVHDLGRTVPARTLVIHTKHWALAAGDQAVQWANQLSGGIAMASTRYEWGDNFTPDQYAKSYSLPVNEAGSALAKAISGPDLFVLPARTIRTASPTTIGLGDAFVGGFLGALAREGEPAWT